MHLCKIYEDSITYSQLFDYANLLGLIITRVFCIKLLCILHKLVLTFINSGRVF